MKFSTEVARTLKKHGFTHFFFVGGGNIMHLTGALAEELTPVPVIHEVAAIIASEYFNKANESRKSLALVTAGPGLTNCLTGIAGAFIESRGVLIIGGQVKTEDLAGGHVRQRGIQEVDGVSICEPLCKLSLRLSHAIPASQLAALFQEPFNGRQGPVFIEMPLDVQARDVNNSYPMELKLENPNTTIDSNAIGEIAESLNASERPMFLIGGGVNQSTADKLLAAATKFSIPVTTTWNGAELVPYDHPQHFGRPNTWGQRSANIILQQSDLLIAIGTRLGLQQTGFNWKQFLPNGRLAMVDISQEELSKGHPAVHWPVHADSSEFVNIILPDIVGSWDDWTAFCRKVRTILPVNERDINFCPPKGYIQPYDFVDWLSNHCSEGENIVPCSSGSANTCMMQTFQQKPHQSFFNNKGLASMGYGLSGAIGVALAKPKVNTYLVEGDGGFAQNLQELGTVKVNKLSIKMFIFDDGGHASIRMTQRAYFDGNYVGCDISTGLGLPNWEHVGIAWDIPTFTVTDLAELDTGPCQDHLVSPGPAIFIIRVHPEQTYFPKITSRVTNDGGMESNPIHLMSPDLPSDVQETVSPYLET